VLQDEKNALREELAASDAARDRARDELKAARGALKFRTPEDVLAEIARLEHLLSHTTMPLNEEKRVMTQIKELGKSRDEVKAHGDRAAKLAGGEESRSELVARIRAKDAEITAVKAERTAVQGALAEVRAKEDAHVAGLPALHEERNKVWESLCAARDAGRKLREAFKAQEDAWWSNERLWRTQQREEKQKRCVPAARRGPAPIEAPPCAPLLPGPAPPPRSNTPLSDARRANRAPPRAAGRRAWRSARRAPRRAASSRRRTRPSRTQTRRVRVLSRVFPFTRAAPAPHRTRAPPAPPRRPRRAGQR
jgi:hypothetical protein